VSAQYTHTHTHTHTDILFCLNIYFYKALFTMKLHTVYNSLQIKQQSSFQVL